MSKAIEFYVEQAQELCVLPDVYLKLKQKLSEPDATLGEIATLISLEPALSSKLLKIANSALFGFPKEVASIDKALMILGLREVENLVNAYGVTAAFSGVDKQIADMDRLWEISVDCALMTKYLADEIGLKNSDSLFLSGLFHNIGALVLVHHEPQKIKYCEQYTKEDTPWERQLDVFGFTYSECSAALLASWQLPEAIIEPLRNYRHAYQEELDQQASLLFVTTRLALVSSHPGMYSKKAFVGQHLMQDLGLTDQHLDDALAYCSAQAMEIMSILEVI
ncbi:HDOD domain-containing protein [Thalassotalea marina]|uniref:HD family phosphohydrolase n=1 Tax=Thalassotalea marina TaxID=1673741 RepID=A0A919BNH7_9GAMM|nr:HDOD domain-containing protein [Thalassotalea marina]GHG01722.1 HD family phosphohydrolase [Thalassotalea marina]